jgi:xanthine dehydrogenase small subunit
VARIGIGAGGVAATPVRAVQTEAFLAGQPWTQATCARPSACCAEFQPISDMRASAAYRTRCWATCCSASGWKARALQQINLEKLPAARNAA